VTDAPIAQAIHPGTGTPPAWRVDLIALWLKAHGINPEQVSADDPITVLTVPMRPAADDSDGPWLIQVIVFSQYFTNPDGKREMNFLTGKPAVCQRTVPLHTPFPAVPTTDGEDRGQADREETQEPAQILVRHQGEEGVPDRHEGQSEERPGAGQTAWNESTAKGRTGRSDQEVSQPEEDRQEEVGGAR
jgi:hypothetical protein